MLWCMRTTIRLNEDLLTAVKIEAARTRRTMTSVIEEALRMSLVRRPVSDRSRITLPVFKGRGLQPGVDLDDTASLLDLMGDSGAAS